MLHPPIWFISLLGKLGLLHYGVGVLHEDIGNLFNNQALLRFRGDLILGV